MYIDPPEDNTPIPVSLPMRLGLIVCTVGMFGIGIWQGPFVDLAYASVKGLF
jgi:NADH:ubiquinone oxidoreductase subunit 2 (subunit N)